MNERDKELIKSFRDGISSDLLCHINKIIVFGSRAREDAEENSDLDIAVLVDDATTEIEKHLDDIVYRVMWDNDFSPMISLKVFSEKEFFSALENGFSFYRNILREGVSV